MLASAINGKISISDAIRAIELGELSATQLTQACIERIQERDPVVHAFVAHDPALALRYANEVDAGVRRGYLSGIPFAVKDNIDSVDYPTGYGSPIYTHQKSGRDAACLAKSREQGGVLIGKVATSEFATQTPGSTRNPLSLEHTPGGSSSGSAAAVADGMVMAAWGTQTTGSITRPAVYCGIVGYKPSFGLISTSGVCALSPLQDTVGVLARTVEDAAHAVFGLHGKRVNLQEPSRPLRLGLCESSQWDYAHPDTLDALHRLLSRASVSGAKVDALSLPKEFEEVLASQSKIVAYEARHSLAHEYTHHFEKLSRRLVDRLESDRDMTVDDYIASCKRVVRARLSVDELLGDFDALVYPATEGEPEKSLAESGSPRFGALWTLLHLPTVAFPSGRGRQGLPLGIQLIGRFGNDIELLQIAQIVKEWSEY